MFPKNKHKVQQEKLKEEFRELKKIGWGGTSKFYKWNGTIGEVMENAADLYINGFGILSCPLDHEQLKKVVAELESRRGISFSQNSCQIDYSQFTLVPKGAMSMLQLGQKLAQSTIQKMLSVNFDNLYLDIEAKVEKLVICLQNQSYHSNFNSPNEPGKFGTILVQVPVHGEQQCGGSVLQDGEIESYVKFERNSYSAAVVMGESAPDRRRTFTIRSGPGELTVVLIFNLIWNDSIINQTEIPPCKFPELITQLNKIRDLLMPWQTVGEFEIWKDETKFFCCCWSNSPILPFFRWDFDQLDVMIALSLKAITFIEVTNANIQMKEVCVDGSLSAEDGEKRAEWEFVQVDDQDPRCSLPEDILKSVITTENLISNIPLKRIEEESYKSDWIIPVLVLHPRNLYTTASGVTSSWMANKLDLLGNIENLIRNGGSKAFIENPRMRELLLKDLKQFLDVLKCTRSPMDDEVCSQSLFRRFCQVVVQLKAKEVALLAFRDVLQHHNAKEWFVCTRRKHCYCFKHTEFLASSFASFVCLAQAWENCPDILRTLMGQLAKLPYCQLLTDIALNLVHNGCFVGAMETFQVILKSAQERSSESEGIGEVVNARLFVLAIYLQDIDPDVKVLDILFDILEHLEPKALTELIERFANYSKSESINCSSVLEKLGHLMSPPRIFSFSSYELCRVLEAYYSTGYRRTIERIWESLCSRCIQIFNSGESGVALCLFSSVLKEQKFPENTWEAIITALTNVTNFKEAVRCSLKMLEAQRAVCDLDCSVHFLEYIDCILLLSNDAQLSGDEIVEPLAAAFSPSFFSDCDAFMLANDIAVRRFSQVCDDSTPMRRILEVLLRKLGALDANDMLIAADRWLIYQDEDCRGSDVEILVPFALFGDLELMKSVMDKFDQSIVATAKIDHRKKLSVIYKALEAIDAAKFPSNASFWMTSSRNTFSYLVLEYLKTVENLTNRTYDFVKCFKLCATSERRYGSVAEVPDLTHWEDLIGRITFLETVRIVQKIFEAEFKTEEEVCLQRLPSCWEIFIRLCSSAVDKWDLRVVSTRLSANHLISLVHSFLWIGEKKSIADLGRLINGIPQSATALADVHCAIIRNERTMELATASMQGVLALNELIDARIHILNRRLVYFFAQDALRGIHRGTSNGNPLPDHRPVTLPINKLEFDRSLDNTAYQKEIDELCELRKKILSNISHL